jgi:hypothetical protein
VVAVDGFGQVEELAVGGFVVVDVVGVGVGDGREPACHDPELVRVQHASLA